MPDPSSSNGEALNRRHRVAIAVTAVGEEAPGFSRRSCQRARPRSRGDVLDEEQLAARLAARAPPRPARRAGRAPCKHQGEDGGSKLSSAKGSFSAGAWTTSASPRPLAFAAAFLNMCGSGSTRTSSLTAGGNSSAFTPVPAPTSIVRPLAPTSDLAPHLPQAGLLGRLQAAVVDRGERPPPGRVVDPCPLPDYTTDPDRFSPASRSRAAVSGLDSLRLARRARRRPLLVGRRAPWSTSVISLSTFIRRPRPRASRAAGWRRP